LPSDDLLNSGSSSNADAAFSTRGSSDSGDRGSLIGSRRSGRSRSGRRGALAAVLSIGLIASAVLATSSATAAPKPTLAEVKKKVDRLNDEAEKASEQYNDTREELKSIAVKLKAAHSNVSRQEVELAKAKLKVGRLASETYRRGELSTLNLVLGDDPDAALAGAGYLPSLGERQAASMKRLQDATDKLTATEDTIKAQRTKALAAKSRLKKTKATVEKRKDQAEAQLATLTATQRTVVGSSAGDLSTGAGKAVCGGKAVSAPSGAAKAAINFACQQLGEPYVWAAAGPGSWDCSGLTMAAYQAGGVSLPHSSRMQAGFGTSVSVSSLQAGDLVFFNSPISHVGIFLGDGLMVHAPHTGSVVKVASMYQTPSAAVRLG
jgi:cell wall-associated NlpC family hydrolase